MSRNVASWNQRNGWLRQVDALRFVLPLFPEQVAAHLPLLMFLALPLILSIVISMFHILGTSWQHFTMAIHRWTGLIFAVAAILHTYLAIRTRMVYGPNFNPSIGSGVRPRQRPFTVTGA